MENIKDLFKNFMNFTSRMTPSQVMMLLGVTAGTIVGIFIVVGWLNEITYSRLYSDIDESEAGEVITYLNDNKIPYRLSNNGTSIEVPSDDVYKVRISLAAEGLPRGANMGYSIFDQNNLGMTDFLQNLNFRRALEGELTRTIMQLNEVQAARVHIVMPKQRLFKEDQKEATASVLVKLKGSSGLNKQQISGITHLVASSVEGLNPDNISIIDYNGNLLSSGSKSDAIAGLSTTQLEVRKEVENYLQDKAQTMLDGVLGQDKSIIRVTADLNFQQIERTSESFDANSPSVRSEEHTKTTATANQKSEETSESGEENSSETTITNYELNKTVEHIINEIGSIERLSSAVMVDGDYNEVINDAGETEQIYQPRSQEDLDQLAAIVKNAVGFNQQRNDQIEMVNLSFDRQNLEYDQEMLDSMYMRDFYLDIAKKIGYILLVVFLFLYLKKKSNKLFGALKGLIPPPPPPPKPITQPMAESIQEEEVQPIQAGSRKPRLVDQMQETAKKSPEEIAKVIKTMMIE